MTENSESENEQNISRLREMAIRGDEYRETIDFSYYGDEATIYVRPLTDPEFLPIAAFLENRLDIDAEEAQEELQEAKMDDTIDPSEFDEEFVKTMHEAAVLGVDTEKGAAEGEDEQGVREIVEMLQGGKSLVIAEKVLSISSDADSAEAFRRDGGGE